MTLGNNNGTDGQTDRQTDRVRRNMRPPPREEGRIINIGLVSIIFGYSRCHHATVSSFGKRLTEYRSAGGRHFILSICHD